MDTLKQNSGRLSIIVSILVTISIIVQIFVTAAVLITYDDVRDLSDRVDRLDQGTVTALEYITTDFVLEADLLTASSSINKADHETVVDLLSADEMFTTLVSNVVAADLVETLSDEDATFTVFAPTNQAFEGVEVTEGELAGILTYHVISTRYLANDVLALEGIEDGVMVETVNGAMIELRVENDTVYVNDIMVSITDKLAGNGVVHVIEGVLVP